MNTEINAIADILRKAFQVEVDGLTFYTMTAESTANPASKALFERLARDETEHQAYLRSVMRRYEEHGASSFAIQRHEPELAEFSSAIFTDNFRDQATGEEFELGALSIGMQLEATAVEFFDASARNATDPQIGGFFRFLADWEDLHLRTLQQLYDSIRVDA
jgi:rubrerythrin